MGADDRRIAVGVALQEGLAGGAALIRVDAEAAGHFRSAALEGVVQHVAGDDRLPASGGQAIGRGGRL